MSFFYWHVSMSLGTLWNKCMVAGSAVPWQLPNWIHIFFCNCLLNWTSPYGLIYHMNFKRKREHILAVQHCFPIIIWFSCLSTSDLGRI
jgi:hypothetical protein